jgi:hypothetical protein
MKKISVLIILIGILFSSCFKTEMAPVLIFDGEANMTIAEFHQLRTLSSDLPTLIDSNIIITGIVTSTDEFGSAYQELFFQDSTGGISIRIANSSYHTKYRMGQRIFVKTKDIYLGNYASGDRYGFYQIGFFGNGRFMNLPTSLESRHIFRSDVPGALPAPKIITGESDIDKPRDYHTLVRLENCYFTQANGSIRYFEPSGTLTTISQNIGFSNGTGSVQARISKFCDFADDILPEGALNITGILTMFGTIPQLIICRIDDVKILPPAPPAKILASFDMKTNPFDKGWQNIQKTGNASWTYTGTNVMAQPPAGEETECWFVSPKFNFSGEKDVALSFSYRLQSGTSDNIQVLYTIDGSDWKPLSFTLQVGATTETTIKLMNDIATNPNLQIKFRYKTTTVFPMCAIYNVTFRANVN